MQTEMLYRGYLLLYVLFITAFDKSGNLIHFIELIIVILIDKSVKSDHIKQIRIHRTPFLRVLTVQ